MRRALAGALRRMGLEARVREALPDEPLPFALAVGKAAPAMMRGALARWPELRGLVVTTDGTDVELPARVRVLFAGHPVPDRRSVRAADEALALEGPLLVLVSGGASALLCAPAPGVTLARKREVTRALITGGATIRELNVVRKHLSRIKGGGLSAALTLVASDVVGGGVDDVGSGPSVRDTSTLGDARRILARYGLEAPLLPRKRAACGPARIIASPEEHARVLAAQLGARLLPPSDASVDVLAREYMHYAHELGPGEVLVRAAEPSLEVTGRGRGGRSTHLAALVGLTLPRGVSFCASATDGVDGTSGTAGALVDARLQRHAPRVRDALRRFDTGPLHLALGTALPGGPTGHNLADVHVLWRRR